MPSRFDEPAVGIATVILIATDWPADLERAIAALRATSPTGTSMVVVADGPSDDQAAAMEELDGDDLEVVWTSERPARELPRTSAFDARRVPSSC